MYRVILEKSAKKALGKIPKPYRVQIVQKLEILAKQPRRGDIKSLQGKLAGYHRLRVGNFRVIYVIHNQELVVVVVKIADRKEIYH